MGYSAYVECNCYKEGKTVEPPYKQFMVHDEYGWHLEFEPETFSDEEYQMKYEFEEWLLYGCEHKRMEYCEYPVGTLATMNKFIKLIENIGGQEKFPFLIRYLPTYNGDCVPVNMVNGFKRELDYLESNLTDKSLVTFQKPSVVFEIIENLKKLCLASLETGNPIQWA